MCWLNGELESVREESPEPPSPVPTEIVDNVPEDYVRTAKCYGIKVRDFVDEPQRPTAPPPKEVWVDPWITLVVHDQHMMNPDNFKYTLSGKFLRRLLEIGFVSEEEAERNWSETDKEHLKDFDEGGFGARGYVISKHRTKPTAAARERMRVALFGDRSSRDKELYIPPDTPDCCDGGRELDEFIKENWASHGELFFTGCAGPTRREILEDHDGLNLRTWTIPNFDDMTYFADHTLPSPTHSPPPVATPPLSMSRPPTPDRTTMNPISNLMRAISVSDIPNVPADDAESQPWTVTPPMSPGTPFSSSKALPITPAHTTAIPTLSSSSLVPLTTAPVPAVGPAAPHPLAGAQSRMLQRSESVFNVYSRS